MMKKITLMFTLLAMSYGYSQDNLPYDFGTVAAPTTHGLVGDPNDPITVENAVDPDDANNSVLSITGNGSEWDNAQVNFANNIDLSDDNNNTITFMFKNTANDGVHTHALKFEAGSGPDTELTFTTEDDQWKSISLDFPAGLGNYSKMVIFTDFGVAGPAGTYLIDDIAGASHLTVVPEFMLPVDFSDEVNDQMFGGDNAVVNIITDPDDAGNNVLEIVGSGQEWDNAQVVFASPLDLSDDANNTMRFRMRSTTADAAEVNEHLFKFEQPTSGGDQELTFTTTGTDWTDIELDFGPGLSSYGKLVIMVDWGGGPSATNVDTYLVDDIMAPGPTVLSVDDFESSSFKAYPNPTNGDWNISGNTMINKIAVYNVLGKQVIALEPNTNETVINASSLNSGIYFARIEGQNGIKTIKLIKE